MTMPRDELEFAISQYLDGTLPPLETVALEERLARDEQARALLGEYRQLDTALRSSTRAPSLAWERLHQHLSGAVAGEEPPTRVYSIAAWRAMAAVALAACLTLIAGIGFMALRTGSETPSIAVAPTPDEPIVIVAGPQVEQPAQPARTLVEVAIGPAPTPSHAWRYAESVISRPAVVMIDRVPAAGHDRDGLWN